MTGSKGYQALKRYTLFVFKQFYREIIIVGKENLPNDDSAVIFAPNHLNALMDALAASYILPRNRTVVYLARADLFRKKYLAKIMYFVNILPAFRMRDGIDNLNKNEQSFAASVDALEVGKYLCIMPEGGQGEERKIRPLVKGIFRIAFNAQEKFGENKKVKIIPLGLDLEDLNKSNTSLIINIGRAIELEDYHSAYKENPTTAINEIRDELHHSLSNLTRDYATSQYYEDFETICNIIADETHKHESNQLSIFNTKQETAKKLLEIEKTKPQLMEMLSVYSKEYSKLMNGLKLKSRIFTHTFPKTDFIKQLLSLFITLPIFLFGIVSNALPYLLTKTIRKLMKIEYSGFISSVSFVIAAIVFPLLYLIQASIFHQLFFGNLLLTLLFFSLQFFLRRFTLQWMHTLKELYEAIRYNRIISGKTKQSNLLSKIINYRNKIIHNFEKA